MRKGIKYGLLIFIFCWLFKKETQDKDYFIDDGTSDTTIPKNQQDTTVFIKPDTTPYKGNYIDIQQ